MAITARPAPEAAMSERSLRRGMLVLAVLMLGLAVTGVGGFALFGIKSAQAGKTPAGPVFAPLPSLEFALSDGERTRQVDLDVVLELPQGMEKAQLAAHVTRIANALNARLIEVEPGDLSGPAGTQRVKDVVSATADRELRPMRVRQVLLQKLVMR
ncbi:MAG TPA: flagellar basal body-associated FliL family protein [Azospirillum sp.]|nr:flagellar basal body-associated FliL family protein [Azospirillum sp.]